MKKVILLILLLCLTTSCSLVRPLINDQESTAPETTEQTKTPQTSENPNTTITSGTNDTPATTESPIIPDNQHLITLYFQSDSDEYHALTQEIIKIDTNIEGRTFRMTTALDGIRIELQEVKYVPEFQSYEVVDKELFVIEHSETNKAYEFSVNIDSTIPRYRLLISKNDYSKVFYLADSGEEAYNVLEIKKTEVSYQPPSWDIYIDLAASLSAVLIVNENQSLNYDLGWIVVSATLSSFYQNELLAHTSDRNYGYMMVDSSVVKELLKIMYHSDYMDAFDQEIEHVNIFVKDREPMLDVKYMEYDETFKFTRTDIMMKDDKTVIATIYLTDIHFQTDYIAKITFSLVDKPNLNELSNYEIKDVQINKQN